MPDDVATKCGSVSWNLPVSALHKAWQLDNLLALRASVMDSGSFRLSQAKLGNRVTQEGKLCKLPFEYRNFTYDDCTNQDTASGVNW